jgi:hypothetical protein
LTVGLWTRHDCLINEDVELVAELQEIPASELGPVVSDDGVRDPELVDDVMKNVTACSALRFLTGRTSTHLENLSMATSRWV